MGRRDRFSQRDFCAFVLAHALPLRHLAQHFGVCAETATGLGSPHHSSTGEGFMGFALTSSVPHIRLVGIAGVMAAVTLLSGCAATQTAIAKRDLDVQTKMSATIFLDPVPAEQMSVFVQVRNTSDKPDFDLAPDIINAVTAKGYTVVRDPKQAKYYLQANVLHVGKTDQTAIQQQLGGGYGAGLAGGALGMAMAGATAGGYGASGRGLATGALLGSFAEVIAGSMVKDVYYSIVTDVQIKERLDNGKRATLNSNHNNKQGTSGAEVVTYTDEVDMKTYQTRIVSTANKVNLEFAEAVPVLRTGLTRALSGVF
jgi:outer membrane lipoprotein SlyB